MKKSMSFKTIVLALGVLLSNATFAADSGDVNLTRSVNGSDVLRPGASTTTDVCECNTVGGTILPVVDRNRYDYSLATENPKDGSSSPSGSAGGVDGPAGN